MAILDKDTLKGFFNYVDQSSDSNFQDLIESAYNQVDDSHRLGAKTYDPTKIYQVDDTCLYTGDGLKLYRATATTTGSFDAGSWQPVSSSGASEVISTLRGGVPSAGDTLNKLYSLVTSLGELVGDFDASSGALPTIGNGLSGAINKGDSWHITVAGTLPSGVTPIRYVKPGDILVAKVAGATSADQFYTIEANLDQASPTIFGLVKLYADLSASNTDGSVSQSALVTAFGLKMGKASNLSDLTDVVAARNNLGIYHGFSSLASSVLANTILYERGNTYICLANYSKGASLQTDFTSNWQLVGEGKKTVTASVSGAVSVDASTGNVFILTVTGNITSFTVTNTLAGHSYYFRFIRSSGSATGYTCAGLSGSVFKSSYGIQPTLAPVSAWVSGTTYATGSMVSFSSGSTFYYKRTNVITGFGTSDNPTIATTWWEVHSLVDMWFGLMDHDGRMLINSQNLIENSNNLGW